MLGEAPTGTGSGRNRGPTAPVPTITPSSRSRDCPGSHADEPAGTGRLHGDAGSVRVGSTARVAGARARHAPGAYVHGERLVDAQLPGGGQRVCAATGAIRRGRATGLDDVRVGRA